MADLIMLVDSALVEVPVNILPLLDDTDFKTRETGIAYNAAGMDLVWNFVTKSGAFTQTAVTPTTAGDYDWTHQGDGMYTIEIPASGGASINNDTEGFGWFTGLVTGVLPWRGPIIQFSPANVVNSLVDASDLLDVNVAQVSEDSAAANNLEAEFDGTGYLGDYVRTGTAQSGAAGNIVLDSGASTIDEFYKYMVVAIIAGTGAGQARTIVGYTGSSRQADVEPNWGTNPNSSSVFVVRSWDTGTNVRWFAESNVSTVGGRPEVHTSDVSTGAIDAGDISSAARGEIADAIWDEDIVAAHNTVDTAGALVRNIFQGRVIRRATAQAGAAASITLDASASAINDFYNLCWVVIVSGPGVGQVRQIFAYNGTTKVATIIRSWFTNPTSSSVFEIIAVESVDIQTTAGGQLDRLLTGSTWSIGAAVNFMSLDVITATALADSARDEIVDQVWDELRAAHTALGSFGQGVVIQTNNDKTGYSIGTGGISAASFAASAINAAALATDAVDEIWAKICESQGSYTAQQILSILLSACAGVTSSSGSVLKSPNGVATRITATLDASENRTAMTLTPSA